MSQLYNFVVGGVQLNKPWILKATPTSNFIQYDGPPIPAAPVQSLRNATPDLEPSRDKQSFADSFEVIHPTGSPMFSPDWWLGIYTMTLTSFTLAKLTRGVLGRTPIFGIAESIYKTLSTIN